MRALALALLLCAAPAFADPVAAPDPLAYSQLPDAGQERAAQALMRSIRCVVCQAQTIADSDADLAGDMRALIRHRVAAGEPPATVRRWLIERYGDWVSYAPPLEPLTWPLWGAPLLLVAAGMVIARGTLRRRR